MRDLLSFYVAKATSISRLIIVALCFCAPLSVSAANLSLVPASGTYTVGDPIAVSVYVASSDRAVNALSGVVSFPPDTLEVTSISKNQSIISLWVEEPVFVNTAGTVSFEGVVLNPGFTGASGKIVTINFRVKKAGSASLSFVDAAALANDGEGTDILSKKGTAQFVLIEKAVEEEIAPNEPSNAGTPAAPKVTSTTHGDTKAWYRDTTARLAWTLENDVTSVRTLVDAKAESIPTVVYQNPIVEREITDLTDGISYFHVQARNSEGWGAVSHFPLHIDTRKPESFDLSPITREDHTDPTAGFILSATDGGSGIASYELQIDTGDVVTIDGADETQYRTPVVPLGKHIVIAKVYDRTGNYRTAAAEFTVDPIDTPVLTDVPETIVAGERFRVSGTTYPNSTVTMNMVSEKGDTIPLSGQSGVDGYFTLEQKLDVGVFSYTVFVQDARGAMSLPSATKHVTVVAPVLMRTDSMMITILSIVIPLLALLLMLVLLLVYGWRSSVHLKKRIRGEVSEAQALVRKSFAFMQSDIEDDIKMLEKTSAKRKLTREEVKLLKRLKESVAQIETGLMKEIADISDVVNK